MSTWPAPWSYERDSTLPPPVQVGDPATYGIGGDRYPMVVVEVRRNRREVTVQGTGTVAGMRRTFTWRPARGNRNGRYVVKGGTYGTLSVGIAIDHRDPSF